MNGDFAKALPRILVYEGGKVDNPRDPGGRTNKGITQATYNSFCREYGRPHRDVYEISMDEVATIYKDRYWDEIGGDELPAGLDLCVFDGGVNSGPSHSIIWLQQALGDGYQGAVDGRLGSKTLQAIQDHGDVDGLIEAYCSHRLATLERLKTWGEFGKGWHARIANCQKTGEAWADGSAAPLSGGRVGRWRAHEGPDRRQHQASAGLADFHACRLDGLGRRRSGHASLAGAHADRRHVQLDEVRPRRARHRRRRRRLPGQDRHRREDVGGEGRVQLGGQPRSRYRLNAGAGQRQRPAGAEPDRVPDASRSSGAEGGLTCSR